jgi:drug/metabolite transporter (DMT)-like permease
MIFISAAAFTLWTFLLKYNPAGKVAVFSFLTPVFGALLSSLVLSESLFSVTTLAALLLVAAGIWTVNR